MHCRRIVNQIVVGVAVAVLAAASQAGYLYVDDDNCPGPGDGSYKNPYCSIQTAIDNAVDTDEIIVAPGTYLEMIDFLGKAVALRSSGGPEVTIIDGTGNFHVVRCVSQEGPDTVLEGFTITGGNAEDWDWPDNNGGGIILDSSSPTVTNCTISGNSASYSGGGMCNYNSSPTVTDCTFSGNVTVESYGSGGGGMSNFLSSPAVANCTFVSNEAAPGSIDGIGGGMFNHSDSTPTVTDSAFCGNSPVHIDGPVVLVGQIDMSAFCPIPVCPSDTNGDGTVNVQDFLLLLAVWGVCP
jgi:parallel beta-helix repeat protein